MRRPTLAATFLVALVLPAPAAAGVFPGDVVDGPSPDIVALGDVDLARDGGGALVYVKRVEGVERALISPFVGGAYARPVRVDEGLGAASAQPVVAVADGGRVAVAFVNGGSLWAAVKPRGAPRLGAPTLVAEGAVSDPSIDMSINGATYLSYTQAGDVRVARAARDRPSFTVLPEPVDVSPGREAGTGALRSRVAASADGTGLVAWGERGDGGRTHVHARRVFEQRLSALPQDLTLSELDGRTAGGADSAELDIGDDSSFAQVVFRQQTAGGSRLVMRRLVGSAFDPPVALDQGAPGERGRVDLAGRGDGLYGAGVSGNDGLSGLVDRGRVRFLSRLGTSNGVDPRVVPAIGERGDGGWAWMQGSGPGDAVVRARYVQGVAAPRLEPDATLSQPGFGPVDPAGGLDAGASRTGDISVAFVQGTGADRRLMAGTFDRPPRRPTLFTRSHRRRAVTLRWSGIADLLGGLNYRVVVGGRTVGRTRTPQLAVPSGRLKPGTHRWYVVAADRRGQTARSRTGVLRIASARRR